MRHAHYGIGNIFATKLIESAQDALAVTQAQLPQYGGTTVPSGQISYTGDLDADVAAGAPGAAQRDAIQQGSRMLMWLAIGSIGLVSWFALARARR